MKVLIDTCVWSLALRRKTLNPVEEMLVQELKALCAKGRAAIIGPIRQEVLSGIRDEAQYLELKDRLRAFQDLPLTTATFETAAMFFNDCRRKGIQGSQVDFLICAAAVRYGLTIFTTDQDFKAYQTVLDIHLFG